MQRKMIDHDSEEMLQKQEKMANNAAGENSQLCRGNAIDAGENGR